MPTLTALFVGLGSIGSSKVSTENCRPYFASTFQLPPRVSTLPT